MCKSSRRYHDGQGQRWLNLVGKTLGCASLAITLLSNAAHAENGITSDEILLGQSTALIMTDKAKYCMPDAM